MNARVIFWGGTGQAKVLRELLLAANGPRLVAVVDNRADLTSPFVDVPLLIGHAGLRDWLALQAGEPPPGFLIAIGGRHGGCRLALQAELVALGLLPLIAIHPTAFVAPCARIGAGSQILACSAICVEVVLGLACIVNTAASIDHECRLGDGVHVAPGARLAGCVTVGSRTMIGTGAIIAPHITIGADAVIGAGAVVLKDVPSGAVIVGNPGRPLKKEHRQA
jgi:sugar O-acyltransferase (sialic acid O-acetyltransferase NeuD family)